MIILVENSLKNYFRDLSALLHWKMAVQGGIITPEFGYALGLSFMEMTHWDRIILAIDAGCLLFILFGKSLGKPLYYLQTIYSSITISSLSLIVLKVLSFLTILLQPSDPAADPGLLIFCSQFTLAGTLDLTIVNLISTLLHQFHFESIIYIWSVQICGIWLMSI